MLQTIIAEAGLSDDELQEKIDRTQAILSGLQLERSNRMAKKQREYDEAIDAVKRQFALKGFSPSRPWQEHRDTFGVWPAGQGVLSRCGQAQGALPG